MPAFTFPTFTPRISARVWQPRGGTHRSKTYSRKRVSAVISDAPKGDPAVDQATREAFDWVEQWYPVMLERDAPVDEPHQFQLFDRSLVLFCSGKQMLQSNKRLAKLSIGSSGSNIWTVLDDRCSHRLAPLSEGRITYDEAGNAELECAYHGWAFGGCGTCTRIPQLEEGAKIPRRSAVRSYDTAVRLGMIWMYFGSTPTVGPLPTLEVDEMWEKAGVRAQLFMRYLPYGLETLLDNLTDPEHVHWVHHNANSQMKRSLGGKYIISSDTFGTSSTIVAPGSNVNIQGGVRPPCLVWYKTVVPGVVEQWTGFFGVPRSRYETAFFSCEFTHTSNKLINWLISLRPAWVEAMMRNCIVDGDNSMLNAAERNLGDPELWKKHFLPVRSDKWSLEFRRWMDLHRKSMPFLENVEAPPPSNRFAMLDRYESQVKYCKSSQRAQKGFNIAHSAVKLMSWVFACTIIYLLTAWFIMQRPPATAVHVVTLCVLLAATLILRSALQRILARFTFTDVARKRMLST